MPSDYHHGVRVIELNEGTRPIRTVETGIIGVVGTAPDADNSVFPENEPVLIIGSRSKAAKLGTTGTLPMVMDAIFDQVAPMIVVVRVPEFPDAPSQISEVIGTVTPEGKFTGLQALLVAQSKLHVKPRILGAPGFADQQPVADELGSIAEKLRGFAYVDAPAGTAEDAVAWREQFGNKRLMPIFPGWKVWDTETNAFTATPASARALGMRAKLDNDIGWHKTLSNVPVNGVSGITADIDWDLQNPTTKAGYLNANEVTTLIMKDGYRFWGSRTCSADPMFAFESAVRTGDVLADTIAEAHLHRDVTGGLGRHPRLSLRDLAPAGRSGGLAGPARRRSAKPVGRQAAAARSGGGRRGAADPCDPRRSGHGPVRPRGGGGGRRRQYRQPRRPVSPRRRRHAGRYPPERSGPLPGGTDPLRGALRPQPCRPAA